MSNVIPFGGKLSRAQVVEAERQMIERGTPADIPVSHRFGGGVYAREIIIPAQTILTGKIHKKENLNLLVSGVIHVSTENGIQRLEGPTWVISPPGTKRIAFTETMCIWVTFHSTDERNVDEIEKLFVCDTDEQFRLYVEEQARLEVKQ